MVLLTMISTHNFPKKKSYLYHKKKKKQVEKDKKSFKPLKKITNPTRECNQTEKRFQQFHDKKIPQIVYKK
jgi:hypothetical protein